MAFNISCVYYPTTVVVVDDNKVYLKNIQYKIGKHTPCKAYSDPEEALGYIKNAIKKNNPLKGIVGIDEHSDSYSHLSSQLPLQYDVAEIYKHVYIQNRFDEISVIVVDFAMPSMNGEEFCKQLRRIKGNQIRIIMLTGEADDPKAIKLFNAGIIDRFLRKGQEGLDEDLINAITEEQRNYFQNLSHPIIEALSADENSCLSDPAFTELFDKICQEISATSYYLIELSGSFILFDDKGSPSWLIIKTLDELKELADFMDDKEVPEKWVDAVKNGEMIPYFSGKEDDVYSDNLNVEDYLHKAQRLKGKKEYCYALLSEAPEFPLKKDKIFSFRDYINSL